jgi:hypothetical protein
MALTELVRTPPRDGPLPLERHAAEQLRFIRDTMERAAIFTAVPGWAGVVIGGTATLAGWFANGRAARDQFAIWLVEACFALLAGSCGVWLKARRARIPLASRPGRRALAGFLAPLFAGAVLTVQLFELRQFGLMPAVWLLLYGAAVISAGAHSVRVVPLMGACFAALGLAASITNAGWGNIWMTFGFGGLHVVFGLLIARKYGG